MNDGYHCGSYYCYTEMAEKVENSIITNGLSKSIHTSISLPTPELCRKICPLQEVLKFARMQEEHGVDGRWAG